MFDNRYVGTTEILYRLNRASDLGQQRRAGDKIGFGEIDLFGPPTSHCERAQDNVDLATFAQSTPGIATSLARPILATAHSGDIPIHQSLQPGWQTQYHRIDTYKRVRIALLDHLASSGMRLEEIAHQLADGIQLIIKRRI